MRRNSANHVFFFFGLFAIIAITVYLQQRHHKRGRRARRIVADIDHREGDRIVIDWGTSRSFLTVNASGKTANGLTLIPTSGAAQVALVKMDGTTVHTWNVDAARARLLPNGNLLVVHGSPWGDNRPTWRRLRRRVSEYDWDGNQVWNYEAPKIAHHDVQRLASGNTLILLESRVPTAVQTTVRDARSKFGRLKEDIIQEVTPAGKVVWEWAYHKAFSPNFCGMRPCSLNNRGGKAEIKAPLDWTHTNSISALGKNPWHDAGDDRFKPENILALPRSFAMPIIIDRSTGEVVWRYDEQNYKGGLGGPHEVGMIRSGLPGEGNILLMDNGLGTHNAETYVLEINPVTKEVVWTFDRGTDFFNLTRGSAQRLENGNTLISWDRAGKILEVTSEGETVWELSLPVGLTRARRYAYDYCKRCL